MCRQKTNKKIYQIAVSLWEVGMNTGGGQKGFYFPNLKIVLFGFLKRPCVTL